MIGRRQKADLPARRGIARRRSCSVDLDRPRSRRDQAGEEFKQGRFAGAIWAEQCDECAWREIEIDISERPQEAVSFGEFIDGQAQDCGSLSVIEKSFVSSRSTIVSDPCGFKRDCSLVIFQRLIDINTASLLFWLGYIRFTLRRNR